MAKDILKEAIADAKAVREVALANAKAALEEAFTPKLQNMLSAKLSEDLDEENYYEDGSFFKPKQGRIIFFDGQYYKHGVKEVLRNPRYTLATWYKKIENNN